MAGTISLTTCLKLIGKIIHTYSIPLLNSSAASCISLLETVVNSSLFKTIIWSLRKTFTATRNSLGMRAIRKGYLFIKQFHNANGWFFWETNILKSFYKSLFNCKCDAYELCHCSIQGDGISPSYIAWPEDVHANVSSRHSPPWIVEICRRNSIGFPNQVLKAMLKCRKVWIEICISNQYQEIQIQISRSHSAWTLFKVNRLLHEMELWNELNSKWLLVQLICNFFPPFSETQLLGVNCFFLFCLSLHFDLIIVKRRMDSKTLFSSIDDNWKSNSILFA